METGVSFVNPEPQPPTGARETGQFELASWGSRVIAALIDVLIITVILVLLVLPLIGASVASGGDTTVTVGALITTFFAYLAVTLLYAPAFMVALQGSTPGKLVVGIRVMRADGVRLSFGDAVMRELVFKGIVVGIIGQITAGIGFLANYLWPLWDAENRAGHDFMAKTRVVRR